MSVEDTDFSPPTTAVMFLFNNSSHRFRSGGLLCLLVLKFRIRRQFPQNLVELTAAALHFS